MFPKLAPPVDPAKEEETKMMTPSAPEVAISTPSKFQAADFSAFKKGTPAQEEKYFPELKKK